MERSHRKQATLTLLPLILLFGGCLRAQLLPLPLEKQPSRVPGEVLRRSSATLQGAVGNGFADVEEYDDGTFGVSVRVNLAPRETPYPVTLLAVTPAGEERKISAGLLTQRPDDEAHFLNFRSTSLLPIEIPEGFLRIVVEDPETGTPVLTGQLQTLAME
jgi:hypothetical protein